MQIIKTIADANAISTLNPTTKTLLLELTTNLIEANSQFGRKYIPEEDGYTVLVEQDDPINQPLTQLDLPYTLLTIPWEGVSMIDNHYYALYLANNQFGIGFVIPNEPWLPTELQQVLLDNLDPEDRYSDDEDSEDDDDYDL